MNQKFKQKVVVIMIGNIGCGKTTMTRALLQNNEALAKLKCITISKDQLRYSLGDGTYVFNLKYEPILDDIAKIMYRRFLELGVLIIVDETNMNKKARQFYIHLAKEFGYTIMGIVAPHLPMKEAVDRRMANPHDQPDRVVWESVYRKFKAMYEKPTAKEGFDTILFVKEPKKEK